MVATRILGCVVLSLVAGMSVRAKSEFTRVTEPTGAFDRYGNIRWQDEKARLDNFAIALLQDSNYLGYIFVGQAPRMCPREAEARAIRAKQYLINYRHVPWNQVVWMTRYEEELETEFWIIPRDKAISPPVPESKEWSGKSRAVKGCAKRLSQIRNSNFK